MKDPYEEAFRDLQANGAPPPDHIVYCGCCGCSMALLEWHRHKKLPAFRRELRWTTEDEDDIAYYRGSDEDQTVIRLSALAAPPEARRRAKRALSRLWGA